MHLDQEHPSNRGVLDYFSRNSGSRTASFGAHPDIVDYLWDTLGAALPVECRALVSGRAVLVAPTRGVIFAAALGTEYGLRLPPEEFALARAAGAELVHHYRTVDVTLDLARQFGPHWLFGTFDRREPEWCRAALEFAERG